MLDIEDLTIWLPREVVELYQKEGIRELYPPQAEAIERGLLEGKIGRASCRERVFRTV